MKKIFFAALLALCVAVPSYARTNDHQAIVDVPLEPVDSIRTFGRIQGWRALDRDTVIIWATGLRPYLLELARPSPDLRFANAIGVTGISGRVHSRFDSVIVEGIRYPIRQIYRITPADAKALKAI